MKIARFFVVLLVAVALSSTAMAQGPVQNEEFGVSIAAPDGWEVASADDKAIANFKHQGSQSQIQVIATRLMNAEVADTFFSTFHRTLEESNFEEVSRQDATHGGHSGKEVKYSFTHSGVTLEIMVFEFLNDDTAWLVIGYMRDSEGENHGTSFQSVVQNIQFSQN